jgi:hypothetical protein
MTTAVIVGNSVRRARVAQLHSRKDYQMLRKLLAVSFTFALAITTAGAADTASARGNMSLGEIVSKNIAARGGLEKWRAVQTISMEGTLGAGGNQRDTLPVPVPAVAPGRKHAQQAPVPPRLAEEAQLPFVMELMRPRKTRMELQFAGQTAIQVYDGVTGWKLRPYLNRRVVEQYTPDELKMASLQADLDGFLVDYAAKGTQIELAGMEKVENRDAYKLKLIMKEGHAIHIWIDAQTFLEMKMEGPPRRLDGVYHPVEVYFRDYRPVDGLQFPFVLETKVLPATAKSGIRNTSVPVEKIAINKIVVNPKLAESLFSKPEVTMAAANPR